MLFYFRVGNGLERYQDQEPGFERLVFELA
jgi:hypothetical protein